MSFHSYFYSRAVSPSKDTSNHASSVYHTVPYAHAYTFMCTSTHLLAVCPSSRDYIYSRSCRRDYIYSLAVWPSRLHLLARGLAVEITSTRGLAVERLYLLAVRPSRLHLLACGLVVEITSTRGSGILRACRLASVRRAVPRFLLCPTSV